ncbi:hypothetical protein ECZU26_56590 [Escherichia coli]|nr:hypothetical protein ECZU22_52310 [Escherichia coli]GHL34834.1 hypothetical protein ECZU26_56590 [Escherichia coli]
MSYFFVTTLQVFFCIALLSGVLWSRNDPPSLRPLTWTLLTGLIAGVLAGLFIHGSQPVQLLLVGAEVMVSLLFVLSFWWASTRIRYLWQGILIFGAARHWALDPNLGGLTSTHVLNTDLLLNLTAVVLAFAILCLAGVLCAMLLRRIRGLYWPLTLILLVMIWLPLSGNLLLLLMKLQVVPLGKSLLSFVAKVTNNTALYNWAGAALLLARRCAGFRRCCGLFDRRGKPKNRLLTVWRWRSVATLCGCGWSQSAARWSLSQANCGGIKWPRSRRNSLKPCP